MSSLPDGWTQHKDKWNRTFYYNKTTNKTQWQPPQGNAPYSPQMVAELPPGWVGHRDSTSGKMYYVDTSSGISQWTFPIVVESLPNPWTKHKDPNSTRNYYYNPETKESRWTIPTSDIRQKTPEKKETSPEKAWVASKHSDSPASSKNAALFDVVQEPTVVPVTQNSTSATASSHVNADDYTPSSIKNSPEGKANTTTTASGETKNEPEVTVRPVSDLTFLAPSEEELPAGWKSLVDPTSGKSYYYSTFTGKTQWSRPLVAAIPPPPAMTPSSPGLPAGSHTLS